jgi:hypothetical protein
VASVKAWAQEELWKIRLSYVAKEHKVMMWKHKETMDDWRGVAAEYERNENCLELEVTCRQEPSLHGQIDVCIFR